MGKRRSNQNRKKKDSKNVLGNSHDKKAVSVLSQDEENKKNYCTLEVQEPLEVQLSNKNSVASCKKLNEIHASNLRENNASKKGESLTTENIVQSCKNFSNNLNPGGNKPSFKLDTKASKLSGEVCNTSIKKPSFNLDTKANKLSGEVCNTSIKKPQNEKNFVYPREISESDLRYEFPVNCAQKDSTLQGRRNNNSTSCFPIEKSVMIGKSRPDSGSQNFIKKEGEKLTFARSVIDESDKEYSSSDFYKPNFNDWSESKNNKMPREEQFHRPPYKSNLSLENIFASEASCSGYRNSSEKHAFNDKILKDTISCSVHAYTNSKDSFSNIYRTWLPQRKDTLQKLETLKSEVHNMQLSYNKSQETLRGASLISRREKNSDNQVIDFFASFAAFLSDATSGIVSVVQAFNVESYQNKFKEIMELDAETTQQLYKARSLCVAEYHNIEEVMRKFHTDNLSSTIGKISDSLEMGKYWEGMKKAYEKDNMPELLDVVGKFFDNACQSTKLQEVSDTVGRYIDDNPATLDAFKSAGRATYGAIDTFKLSRSQNKVCKEIDFTANQLLMIDDKLEIQRLKSAMGEEDSPQSKLEAQIEEAIDHLRNELREIQNIYFELYKNHSDSDSNNIVWDEECDNSVYY